MCLSCTIPFFIQFWFVTWSTTEKCFQQRLDVSLTNDYLSEVIILCRVLLLPIKSWCSVLIVTLPVPILGSNRNPILFREMYTAGVRLALNLCWLNSRPSQERLCAHYHSWRSHLSGLVWPSSGCFTGAHVLRSARGLTQNYILKQCPCIGIPKEILTDKGTLLMSCTLWALYGLLGIK